MKLDACCKTDVLTDRLPAGLARSATAAQACARTPSAHRDLQLSSGSPARWLDLEVCCLKSAALSAATLAQARCSAINLGAG